MSYLAQRFREPSTYAGIAAILGAFGVSIAPETWQAIVGAGSGLAGLAAVLVGERR